MWAGSILICSSEERDCTRQLSYGSDWSFTVQKGNGSLLKGLLKSHLEDRAQQHLPTKIRPFECLGKCGGGWQHAGGEGDVRAVFESRAC